MQGSSTQLAARCGGDGWSRREHLTPIGGGTTPSFLLRSPLIISSLQSRVDPCLLPQPPPAPPEGLRQGRCSVHLRPGPLTSFPEGWREGSSQTLVPPSRTGSGLGCS